MKTIDLREFKAYCPICGSPHFRVVEMKYEWMRHDKLVTVTSECEACRSTITKEFMNPDMGSDEPYWLFTEDVKNHLYQLFVRKL